MLLGQYPRIGGVEKLREMEKVVGVVAVAVLPFVADLVAAAVGDVFKGPLSPSRRMAISIRAVAKIVVRASVSRCWSCYALSVCLVRPFPLSEMNVRCKEKVAFARGACR